MKNIIYKIFSFSKNFDTEIILENISQSLTRFGDNEISQNVYSNDLSANIKILRDGRIFKFSLNQFDSESIKRSFKFAEEYLKFQKRDKTILPLVKGIKSIIKDDIDENIVNLTPKWRADKIKRITEICSRKKILSYGILRNGIMNICFANSNGVYHEYNQSFLDYELTVKNGNGYGAAFAYSNKEDINFDEINEIALKKAQMSINPIDIEPGKYDVILEEQPVYELLQFFSYYGFSAQNYIEKKSFICETFGKKIFPDFVNIEDNAIDGESASMPFDFEGCPKKKVVLVANGKVNNMVTDRKTSAKLKIENTGHSLPQPNPDGPIPLNIYMSSGSSSIDKMIKNSERAILITQFHYTNCLKPKTIEITGMTRNGTFFIENGKIKKAIKNLRFNQSAVEAFKNIVEIGDKIKKFREYFFTISCPAIKIKNFNFSSGTKF